MTIQHISSNVQALLANTNKFVTILAGPPQDANKFAGYPSVSHYYSDGESNYATVTQNRRVYEYIVDIYIVPNSATSMATLLKDEAYPLIDEIVQMFDETIDLSSTALGLTKACDIMRPAPNELQVIETDKGTGLVMTITLFCEADITFRNS